MTHSTSHVITQRNSHGHCWPEKGGRSTILPCVHEENWNICAVLMTIIWQAQGFARWLPWLVDIPPPQMLYDKILHLTFLFKKYYFLQYISLYCNVLHFIVHFNVHHILLNYSINCALSFCINRIPCRF